MMTGRRDASHAWLTQQKQFIASCSKHFVPDGTVGSVWVMGRDSSNGGAHFGVLRNNHLAKWRGKDGWLVHIFHCHPDWCCVAKWAQAQEVGVNIPVCSFNSQQKAAFGFKVERLEETDKEYKVYEVEICAFLVKTLVGLWGGKVSSVIFFHFHFQSSSYMYVNL